MVPLIPGIVGGFLLLESREEGTIKALLVAPTPLQSYVAVACLSMAAVAFVVMLVTAPIIGVGLPPWPALIAISLAAAPSGPAYALLLSSVANNKVEAFAYAKLFGVGPLFVLGTYFLAEPWQWLAVIYPPYCACKAYWVAEAGGSSWSIWVIAGLLSSAVWVAVLQRVFVSASRR